MAATVATAAATEGLASGAVEMAWRRGNTDYCNRPKLPRETLGKTLGKTAFSAMPSLHASGPLSFCENTSL
jgi:hypothetical protein